MRILLLCSLIALAACDDGGDAPAPLDARLADGALDLGSPDQALADATPPADAAPDASSALDAAPLDAAVDAALDAAPSMDGALVDAAIDATPVDAALDAAPDGGPDPLPACATGFGAGPEAPDLIYGEQSERQRIDLYPTDAPGPAPLFIWIHGGGWRGGSWERVNPAFLALRARGWSVASVGYRLSDADWPAPVSDVKAAIRYLRAHADALSIDPDRFVAAGSSAGGHLVALLGTSAGDAALTRANPSRPAISDAVQAVVDLYGPTDLATMDVDAVTNGCPDNALCHDCDMSPETLLLECRPATECPDRAAEGSPVTYASAGDAPHFILHGDADCTVPTPQSARLHAALEAAGVTSSFTVVPGAGHNTGEVLTDENLAALIAFIDREVRGCRSAAPPPVEEGVLSACHHENCPELAADCEAAPGCVDLDACFADCLAAGRMQCARECLDAHPNAPRAVHQPLYQCARAAGCY